MSILLIVDPQDAFVSDTDIVDAIGSHTDEFDYVVATKFENGNPLYESELDWCIQNNEERISQQLRRHTGLDRVFHKRVYNGMLVRELSEFVQNTDHEEVYVCGFETDSCVLTTAMGLFDLGIRPIVVESWCGAETAELHESACQILRRTSVSRT